MIPLYQARLLLPERPQISLPGLKQSFQNCWMPKPYRIFASDREAQMATG